MKSVLIIKKDSAAKNDIRDLTAEITDLQQKKDILNGLKINIADREIENYQFFAEDQIYKDNKYYKEYADVLFEMFFPTVYDAKQRKNVYYPKEDVVVKDKIKVYVYKWRDVAIPKDFHLVHYLGERDDYHEQGQRILMITE